MIGQPELIIGLITILITNFAAKLGRVYPLLKNVMKTISDYKESKKDGILNQKEKALLYDDIEDSLKSASSIIKGLFPNKSKK